jgi:hypothetical protein
MVKLRSKTGKSYTVGSDVSFIEICDLDGNIGALVNLNNGMITVSKVGDSTFENYCIKYKLRPTNYLQHTIEPFKKV